MQVAFLRSGTIFRPRRWRRQPRRPRSDLNANGRPVMTDTSSVETDLPFRGTHIIGGSTERERLRAVVVDEPDDIAVLVAERISEVIEETVAERGQCVLGLATGSTPLGIYRELIRRHLAGTIEFINGDLARLAVVYELGPYGGPAVIDPTFISTRKSSGTQVNVTSLVVTALMP